MKLVYQESKWQEPYEANNVGVRVDLFYPDNEPSQAWGMPPLLKVTRMAYRGDEEADIMWVMLDGYAFNESAGIRQAIAKIDDEFKMICNCGLERKS